MTSDRKINAKITLSQLHCIPLNLINDIIFEYTPQDKRTPWWQNPGIYLWKTSNPQHALTSQNGKANLGIWPLNCLITHNFGNTSIDSKFSDFSKKINNHRLVLY